MRSLILASAACVALSCAASAADLPSKTKAAAPALAPAFTWTGFYVGAHAGAMIPHGSLTFVGPGLYDPSHGGQQESDVATNPGLNKTALKAGLLAGYNYQTGSMVLGLEADLGWGDSSQTVNSRKPKTELNVWRGENEFTQKMNAHIRGRVGYVWGSTLLFAAGGFAVTNGDLELRGYCEDAPYFFSEKVKHSLKGYSLGAGVEHALTSNISLRAEYLFDDFGKKAYNAGTYWQDRSVSIQTHTIRAALSYKF